MANLFFLAQQTALTTGSDGTGSGGWIGALFVGTFGMILLGLVIITSLFWIWMLIDCLLSDLPSTEKLIWVVVILFSHILGSLLYFFIGRSGRLRNAS